MKIDILTLFPKMYEGFLTESIIKRAINSNLVEVNTHNIRDYSKNSHKKVDDEPYGGGSGMVLMCQPIFDAVRDIEKDNTKVILMTPQGIPFNQKMANNLSKEKHLIIICGHYEGFDERIRSICDMEISIGDYVLTGGELPSMVLTDAVVRLVDNVIEKESHENDSFVDGLLDYPTYTKPRVFEDLEVPDVLLSGNHKEIEEWREEKKVENTIEKRPDLMEKCKYKLYKNNNNVKLHNIEVLSGFSFNPKNNAKRTDIISISNMELMEPRFVSKVANKNIEKRILQLLKKAIIYFEEDSSTDNGVIVLDEAKRLKSIVKTYERYLEKQFKEEMDTKIDMLINEIKLDLKAKALDKTFEIPDEIILEEDTVLEEKQTRVK